MGVPAFFRWLSIKYPRVLCNVQEDTTQFQGGTYVPINTDQPNPNGIEFDNLFLDMNGCETAEKSRSGPADSPVAPPLSRQHRAQLHARGGPRCAALRRRRDV